MENNNNNQQFPLPYDAYAAFDAITLKQLMLERLNNNSIFTDQIFEGSNFNSFIDVIAYSYNVLLYYLNKTSNESVFATSQIYENMNKIVKQIGYNPIGYQSSMLKFRATANLNLQPGVYTIPRYSYFTINDIRYTFFNDVTFIKSVSGQEYLKAFSEDNYLVQGSVNEYPLYTSTGEPFEQFNIVSTDEEGNDVKIDHNSIHVYVRSENGVWEQWDRVESLYLHNGNDKVFECRLNEKLRYTIRFGNNITGKQLNTGNLVSVYYLETNESLGEVGANTLNGSSLFLFETPQTRIILPQVREQNLNLISFIQANNITFENTIASTSYNNPETVEQIRENAPNIYKSQGRLVTASDFENLIKSNYKNIIHDVRVVNNWEYLDGHVKYLYNIGLDSPSEDSRVLYSQVKYADSCNFNDVYIYCVPKIFATNSLTKDSNYLNDTAKTNIINRLNETKLLTVEPIMQDPVYVGIGFGVLKEIDQLNDSIESILSQTSLVIQKSTNIFTSDDSIKEKVYQAIENYFSPANMGLGAFVNMEQLSNHILAVPGVSTIFTERKINESFITVPGLSLALFNPVYKQMAEDVVVTGQNLNLPYFKMPFIFNKQQLRNNITVVGPNYIDSGTREY